jgi:hypothetical protein
MKRIDYYMVQNPWRMPKWVGMMLAGLFGIIVIGSMVTIVQLTKKDTPMAAIAAAPGLQKTATAQPAAVPAPAEPAAVASQKAPPATASKAARASRHHASAAKDKKAAKLAAAQKTAAVHAAEKQRSTIVAKHDSKDKRREKDTLDKLLGL